MYELLKSAGIETPRNSVLNRDTNHELGAVPELIESEDTVQIGDTIFQKVFYIICFCDSHTVNMCSRLGSL